MVEANSVATCYFEVISENENMTVLHKREIEFKQDIYISNYGGAKDTNLYFSKV